MQRNPEELYELGPAAPGIAGAPMLHYLEGFIDAGTAGRLLAEHLLRAFPHETVARFDTDRLIDYRSRRPLMTYDNSRWESYEPPELALHLLRDQDERPFLLYEQRTWRDGAPSHGETGYWRFPGDGTVELVLAHTTGFLGSMTPVDVANSLAWFLLAFAIFNTYMLIGSMRVNVAVFMVFLTLEVTEILLVIGNFRLAHGGTPWILHAGGWAGVRIVRRMPATALRGFAACVGIAIGLYLAFRR